MLSKSTWYGILVLRLLVVAGVVAAVLWLTGDWGWFAGLMLDAVLVTFSVWLLAGPFRYDSYRRMIGQYRQSLDKRPKPREKQ